MHSIHVPEWINKTQIAHENARFEKFSIFKKSFSYLMHFYFSSLLRGRVLSDPRYNRLETTSDIHGVGINPSKTV